MNFIASENSKKTKIKSWEDFIKNLQQLCIFIMKGITRLQIKYYYYYNTGTTMTCTVAENVGIVLSFNLFQMWFVVNWQAIQFIFLCDFVDL